MALLKDFKEFITKGNILELAVAVVVGAAFTGIISSFVGDVITPLLLTPALKAAHVQDLDKLTWGAVKYGNFIAAILKFLIIAFVVFLALKAVTTFIKKKDVAVDPGPSSTELILMEILEELRMR